MENNTKKIGVIAQLLLIILVLSGFYENNILYLNEIVNSVTSLFIVFTFFLFLRDDKLSKRYPYCRFATFIFFLMIVTLALINVNEDFQVILSMTLLTILPMCMLTVNDFRINNKVLKLTTFIFISMSFLGKGSYEYVYGISMALIPTMLLMTYDEDNKISKILLIAATQMLIYLTELNITFNIIILISEMILSLLSIKYKKKNIEQAYLLIYPMCLFMIMSGRVIINPAISMISALLVVKGFIKDRNQILFTAYDLSIGGIETSLINLIRETNMRENKVTIILEEKKGELLKEIPEDVEIIRYKVYDFKIKPISKVLNLIKRLSYTLFFSNTYEFSCCYATYSYCGNKLAKISSKNSTIWVHSNYSQLYKNEKDVRKFYDSREMSKFRRIIFVSNESRNDYLKLYPNDVEKSLVINNFINLGKIFEKKSEKIPIRKPYNKKLLVFVGRLDEDSKRITRIIDVAKNVKNIIVWIIGDGKDKEMYKNLVVENKLEKKVLFLGSIREPYSYINKADYLILTSEYEGFPVVYLEALAMRKQIITTIPVSDDQIDISKHAYIISKDKYLYEIDEIVKSYSRGKPEIDIAVAQNKRKKVIEDLYRGAI